LRERDEAVVVVAAVHPNHAARAVGLWAASSEKRAIAQASGRQRLNIRGAVELETGKTAMIEYGSVEGDSSNRRLEAAEAMYPLRARIDVFLATARYRRAVLVQQCPSQPGHRASLHFMPACCPHLDSMGRLWGVMRKRLTHNLCRRDDPAFAKIGPHFLSQDINKQGKLFRNSLIDDFRVIDLHDFWLVA
jgi:hypothetical protein